MQQNKRRRILITLGILVLAVVFICSLTYTLIRNAFQGSRREPRALLVGATVDTLADLPGDKAYPEALTIGPDGNIYVSNFCGGTIWQITPAGERTTWYGGDEIGAASGLAFAPDGSLYVADRGDCNPRRGTSSIKRIAPDAQSVERIGNIGRNDIPNSLTFDQNGVLFLTDTQHGSVRRLLEDSTFETWWSLPETTSETPQPTGLEYDYTTDTLIIADTRAGRIYRVGFDATRQPLPPVTIYDQPGRELDGLTVDEQGRVFITLFDLNEVAMIQPDSTFNVLATNFREPSDIAYQDGVLYITNFDSVSLAPVVGWILDPSLPFTVDALTLPTPTATP